MRVKTIALGLGGILLLGWGVISVVVELEGRYVYEELGGAGAQRALILYHPSRDAHFSDDLSLALAEGLKAAGFAVARATLTGQTDAHPAGYAIIGVVSNTYYWTPDLPTLRYLKRARLEGISVVGLIGGAGSTGRAERLLDGALRRTGATVIETRSFWLLRPNDERRMQEANRAVATDLARRFGFESGQAVLSGAAPAR